MHSLPPIDQLSEKDIHAVVEADRRESNDLDFKCALPKRDGSAKAALCADVSAFANAGGGYLLYGIQEGKGEQAGTAQRVVGVELGGQSQDQWQQCLEQTLAGNTEPYVQGVRYKWIEVDGKLVDSELEVDRKLVVLAQYVPRSWAGPHFVKNPGSKAFRMYRRGESCNVELGVSEMRDALVQSAGVVERMREWVEGRVASIEQSQEPPSTPVRIAHEGEGRFGFVAVHVLSYSSMGERSILDAKSMLDKGENVFGPGGYGAHRPNLHGCVFTQHELSYAQVYRNGRVEGVSRKGNGGENVGALKAGVPTVFLNVIENILVVMGSSYCLCLEKLGVSPPYAVFTSLIGCKGARGAYCSDGRSAYTLDFGVGDEPCVDRNAIVLPEIVIEDSRKLSAEAFQPVCDALWNVFGIGASSAYDSNHGIAAEWNKEIERLRSL